MAEKPIINPIDKDKVVDSPGLMLYPHTIGGVVIKPIDAGRVKGLAMQAMLEQTEMQLEQIREQIRLLAQQADRIQHRKWVSEQIYLADMSFDPVIGKHYYLYQRADERLVLSLVAPHEWTGKRGIPFRTFIAAVKLLADHTWEILSSESETA